MEKHDKERIERIAGYARSIASMTESKGPLTTAQIERVFEYAEQIEHQLLVMIGKTITSKPESTNS